MKLNWIHLFFIQLALTFAIGTYFYSIHLFEAHVELQIQCLELQQNKNQLCVSILERYDESIPINKGYFIQSDYTFKTLVFQEKPLIESYQEYFQMINYDLKPLKTSQLVFEDVSSIKQFIAHYKGKFTYQEKQNVFIQKDAKRIVFFFVREKYGANYQQKLNNHLSKQQIQNSQHKLRVTIPMKTSVTVVTEIIFYEAVFLLCFFLLVIMLKIFKLQEKVFNGHTFTLIGYKSGALLQSIGIALLQCILIQTHLGSINLPNIFARILTFLQKKIIGQYTGQQNVYRVNFSQVQQSLFLMLLVKQIMDKINLNDEYYVNNIVAFGFSVLFPFLSIHPSLGMQIGFIFLGCFFLLKKSKQIQNLGFLTIMIGLLVIDKFIWRFMFDQKADFLVRYFYFQTILTGSLMLFFIQKQPQSKILSTLKIELQQQQGSFQGTALTQD